MKNSKCNTQCISLMNNTFSCMRIGKEKNSLRGLLILCLKILELKMNLKDQQVSKLN